MLKTCSKCGNAYPATSEYFEWRDKSSESLRAQCRNCQKEYRRAKYAREADKHAQRRKEYYIAHRDELVQYQREYRNENAQLISEKRKKQWAEQNEKLREQNAQKYKRYADKYIAQAREYRNKNADIIRRRDKERYQNNREVYLIRRKQYVQNNHESILENLKTYYKSNKPLYAKHRHLMKGGKITDAGVLTNSEWAEILKYFDGKCAYCGSDSNITMDHVTPIVANGLFTSYNIIPACLRCNSSKNNKPVYEWYPTRPYYSEERYEKIVEITQKGVTVSA